jgi:hypothetical protein
LTHKNRKVINVQSQQNLTQKPHKKLKIQNKNRVYLTHTVALKFVCQTDLLLPTFAAQHSGSYSDQILYPEDRLCGHRQALAKQHSPLKKALRKLNKTNTKKEKRLKKHIFLKLDAREKGKS